MPKQGSPARKPCAIDAACNLNDEQRKALNHLYSIFSEKIDKSVIAMVFNESSCDCKSPLTVTCILSHLKNVLAWIVNSALDSMLSMTGEKDMCIAPTPTQDRLRIQKDLDKGQEVMEIGGATATPDSSAPSPNKPTWATVLNANAQDFVPSPTIRPKGFGKENKQHFETEDVELEKHLKRLQNPNHKLLILMRGLPGSGKSTLAENIAKRTDGHIVGADQYFMKSGFYRFEPSQLGDAHDWTKRRAEDWARIKSRVLIVDNTNLEDWEMMPYAKLADRFGSA